MMNVRIYFAKKLCYIATASTPNGLRMFRNGRIPYLTYSTAYFFFLETFYVRVNLKSFDCKHVQCEETFYRYEFKLVVTSRKC